MIVHSILASGSQAAPTALKVGAGDLVGEVVRTSVGIDGGRALPEIQSRKSELEQGADPVNKVPVIVANSVLLPDSQVNHNGKVHDKVLSRLKHLRKYLVGQVERSKWRSESDKTQEWQEELRCLQW
jgi:hypothetical protein